MNILQVNKYCLLIQKKKKKNIEQAKFKAFKEQIKVQLKAIKDLNISDKTNELKKIEGIIPQNLLNDLNRDKLNKIIDLQGSIKLDF